MRRLIILVIFLVGVGALYWFVQSKGKSVQVQKTKEMTSKFSNNEFVEKKARFEIYTKGTKRIFTDAMYHNLSDDVFITSEDPSVVIIKKEGVTWQEFFDTLPFSLNRECLITGTGQTFCDGEGGELNFYLNGVLENNTLGIEIMDEDVLVVKFE